MSDESAKDVSPLRLKRPVPPAPPPAGEGQPLPPATIPPTIPPTIPAAIPPATIPPTPAATIPPTIPPVLFATIPPTEPTPPPALADAEAGAATIPPTVPLRRRPSLAVENAASPTPAPTQAAAPAPAPAPEPEVVAPVKLRVGAKPPPPPPPGVGAGLPDNLFPEMQGAPLVPLPGHVPLGTPPPSPPPGATPPPPLPGGRLPGTAVIGGPPAGGGTVAPYKLGGANAALMPMQTSAGTRPPMPISAGEAKKKAARSNSARRDMLIFLLIFLLIASLGVSAYLYMTKPDASAEALASMKEKLEKAADLPGKAVENAKESIAGARGAEQSRVDNVIEGKEPSDTRGVGAVSPAELAEKLKAENANAEAAKAEKKPPTLEIANKVTPGTEAYSGVGAGPNSPPPPPAANARFVRYAEGLSVSGVFQGSPARALVDGRLIRAGELIEPRLGVSFVGVDAETKHLILQDATGAQLRVKY